MQLDREFQGQVPPWLWMTEEKWPREWPKMFPINNCRGYMSTSHASGRQTHSTTLQAVRKDWQSLPSSSMASLSISCICSPCDCCRMWAHSLQAVSTSLIAAVHVASAAWIAVTQWALTSLMAFVVWASFWWKVVSKSDTCFLQRASTDALFISCCSQSTSSERALRSVQDESQVAGWQGHWSPLGFLMPGLERVNGWLGWPHQAWLLVVTPAGR